MKSIRLMQEAEINLNAHEIGILLFALENLSLSEENQVAKDYGSASTLAARLNDVWKQMDRSQLHLRHDCTPSF